MNNIKVLNQEEGTKSIYDWLSRKVTEFHHDKYGEKCTIVFTDIHKAKPA